MAPRKRLVPLAVLALVLACAAPAAAEPVITKPLVVDRVVAVVDASPILLSELRQAARPFEKRLDAAQLPAEKRAAAAAQLHKELLERMIGDRLFAAEARRRGLSVSEDEVAAATKSIAQQNKVTVEALMAEAADQGMNAADYAAEVRRQLLEAKVLSLVLHEDPRAPRAKDGAPPAQREVVEALDRTRRELLASLRERTYVEVRL